MVGFIVSEYNTGVGCWRRQEKPPNAEKNTGIDAPPISSRVVAGWATVLLRLMTRLIVVEALEGAPPRLLPAVCTNCEDFLMSFQ